MQTKVLVFMLGVAVGVGLASAWRVTRPFGLLRCE
jgi:hypothetical protein